MLVLSRKKQETVVVGGVGNCAHQVSVTVLAIAGNRVKLGFVVDDEVPVHRLEVWERIHRENTVARPSELALLPKP